MKQTARHALHAVICIGAFLFWLVSMVNIGIAFGLAVLADKVWPEAMWGNCWTNVARRVYHHGGYLQSRLVKRPRIFGKSFIPHAMWLKKSHPEAQIEQTEPLKRITRLRDTWRTVYFRFYLHGDEPHRRPDGDNTAPGNLPQ